MPKPVKKAQKRTMRLRPSDPNRAAQSMLAEHMSRVQGGAADQPVTDPETIIREHMRKIGSKGGKVGGKRRLETMTKKERAAVAKKAAAARWKKG